jgi:hypothetical protein
LSSGNILKGAQAIIMDKNAVYPAYHSAIAFNLKDKFYGLTTAGGDPTLKIEECTNVDSNGFMYTCSPDESNYSVFAVKVSKSEYDKCRQNVGKAFNDKNTVYGIFSIAKISLVQIKNAILRGLRHEKKSQESYGDIRKLKHTDLPTNMKIDKFVCSTFVCAVLYNNVKSVKDYMDEHKLKPDQISPTELHNMPMFKKCFSGKFKDYNKDARKFVDKYKEFEKFI